MALKIFPGERQCFRLTRAIKENTVGGQNSRSVGFEMHCGRRWEKVQEIRSLCRLRTETADAVPTKDTNFLSAPFLMCLRIIEF